MSVKTAKSPIIQYRTIPEKLPLVRRWWLFFKLRSCYVLIRQQQSCVGTWFCTTV